MTVLADPSDPDGEPIPLPMASRRCGIRKIPDCVEQVEIVTRSVSKFGQHVLSFEIHIERISLVIAISLVMALLECCSRHSDRQFELLKERRSILQR